MQRHVHPERTQHRGYIRDVDGIPTYPNLKPVSIFLKLRYQLMTMIEFMNLKNFRVENFKQY